MERESKKINWAKEIGKSLPAIALATIGVQANASSIGSSRSRLQKNAWISSNQASTINQKDVFNGFSNHSIPSVDLSNTSVVSQQEEKTKDNVDLKSFLKQLKKKQKSRDSWLSGDIQKFQASENPNFIGKTKASGTCSFTGLSSYCTSATSQVCTTDTDCNFAGNNPPTDIGLDSTSIGDSSTGTGAVIGNLSTTDADGGDTHTYALVSNGASGSGSCGAAGDDDNASFQVDNTNDDLETSGSVSPGTYSVCIQTHDGTDSYQESFTITVNDTTAPVFQNSTPSVGSIGLTGATVSVDLDEEGTAYYVVVADGAGAPSSAQVKAGQDSGGGAPLKSGNFTTSGTLGSQAFTGLSSGTAYDLYVVAQDDEGSPNLQSSPTLVNFTTNSPDSDGDLTASGAVTEPVGLDTTVDTVGEAVNVFDFTLSDGGTADGLAMTVSQIVVNVSGTSTDTERGNITWRLNGNDVSNMTGTYNAGSDTITFSGISISIADGGSETYTVNAYFNDNTGITEDHTVILSVDGDTDLTVGGSGTSMGATSAVTNGTGTTLDVVATTLVFTTQPAGSTSGSALSTQPVVAARDAFGNTDVDFTEVVTLTESSAGSLSGDVDIAASSGVATFTDVAYTATADQQSFTLTANDDDGTGSNLPTTDANAVTSDVQATKLVFDTQPAPLTVSSGQATAFSTVPVVSAQDANNVVDTGYSTDITLAEVNGAGSATMTGTGDTDSDGATVSITPSSGVSTFTSLSITYTASGGSSETFNLQASSGGLSTVNSSQLTGLVPDSDGDLTAAGGVSEPVTLNLSADTVGEAIDLFDFTISDGGTADGLAMVISSIVVNVSGTSSDTERGNITWRLNGNDASNVTGLYNAGSDTITFSGLSISVADGASETYTVNGYYNTTSGMTDGNTVILSVDGDTDLTLSSTGTQMGTTSAVTNGSGTDINDDLAPTVTSVSVPSNATYATGNNLDFTVNFNENITVNTGGGTPRLALTIGSTTRYASYLSGSGTSALVFRHTVISGDSDSDGISLSATLEPNSGTLQDAAGNNANTTLNSIGSLTAVLVDAVAPTVAEVTAVTTPGNDTTPNLTFSTNEAGTLAVGGSCGSGDEGAVSSGNNTITLTQTDNSTALAAGTYSDCTVTVTDSAGNASNVLTATSFTIDLTAPSGHSVSFDDTAINNSEASSQSFTFASGEVGASYSYTISSSGGGTNVTGSGTLSTATDQITGLDLSGLGDGTLTLSVTVTDIAGNAATAVTDMATLDAASPSGHSVSFDDSTINNTEASSQSFTFAGGEVGADYSYTISSSGGGTNVTGSGTLATATDQITGLDLSGLSDGTLTLSVTLTDTAGNTATAVTDTAALDTTAASGHSVNFDDTTINNAEASSQSFTFTSGEVGASYSYTISSSGGGTNVTGSGTLATATDQITGLDLSGLGDGTLTLSVVVTDVADNTSSAVTDTSTLDTTPASGHSVSFDDSSINNSETGSVAFTFASAEVGASYSYTISSSGGGTNVTGSGTISTSSDTVSSIDVSGLGDGTLTLSVTVTDTAGNAATAVTDTATLDATSPTGHSVSFNDSTINNTEASSQSFTFASGEVGASYSYTISSSGGGTNVTGSGTLATATDQITGLDLSGLSDGTLTLSVTVTDTTGNAATAVTDTATLDTTAASGHSVSFDDSTINNTEASSQSFTFTSGEVGAGYSYTISSSGGGTNVTGSGTLATTTDQITGLDLSGLGDGTLTLSVVVTDVAGNTSSAVTDTSTLDTTPASGHSVSFDDTTINNSEASNQSFTFASAEVGASYSYTISSSGGGTNVIGSGTISTSSDTVSSIDVSGLGDGTLTLSVTVTDTAGNAATAVTDTATLDATSPTGHSVSFNDSTINNTEANSQSFTFASGEVGASYSYTISSSGGGTNVTGSGTLATATDQITGIDLSGLSDGTLTLSVTVTDTAGNAATAVTDTATLDTTAENGQSVAFDDNAINASEASNQSFTFTSGEVGAAYNYTISSSGGGTNVTGSGTLATATDQITGLDLSGLGDGTLTLSVVVTDAAGNTATAVTDTSTLDTTAASGHSVSFDDSSINSSEANNSAFTFAGGEVGASYSYTISSSGGGTNVTGSGTLSTATDQITGLDLSGLADGTLTLSVTVTDTAGNAATAVTDTATLDATSPSGHSVSFDDPTINTTEASSQSFTFASGEVGADYNYTISSSGGGTNVTGSGTLATATDQITGLDLSGLSDGTLTLSVTVTDTAGNAATAVTDTATLDTTAENGQSVAFDDNAINASEASNQSFTFTSGEVGASYSYTISSSGGGTNVTGSGTLATATDQITGLDLSGLGDGTLTLSVVVTDVAGNTASAITDTSTLDTTATSGHSVSFDDSTINSSEASNSAFTFAGGEIGASYSYTISSSGGGTNVTGSGTLSTATDQITGLDLSGLADGTLTLSVTVTDTAGNAATAVTDTATLDATSPSGHSVSFDDPTINTTEASSQSFTFADGEVGADYSYTISSSGGGTNVTGSGTLSTATDQITGLDLSGLSDGTLTLSVVLTDTTGNAATAVTDTTTLDTNGPSLSSSTPADGSTTARYDTDLTLTFNETVMSGSSGNLFIAVYDASDDSLIESNDSNSGQVNVNGSEVTVTLASNLEASHSYYVQIGSDAFEDSIGNKFTGISDTTTLNFTTTNLQPTATNDTSTTNEEDAVAINVLSNDSDADGSLNAASVTVTNNPSNGSTSVNTGTGVITYTPNTDFNGTDSFTYTVEDSNSLVSSAATVTITVNAVNDAPVAIADLVSTPEDTPLSVDVASNDTDVDSGDAVDSSTITIISNPSEGSAVVNSGQVDYTPNADFNGSDTFTYTIEDGNGATSNTATVTINVTSVNDLPTATDDSATVDEDDSIVINVLTNDSDIDGTIDASTVSVQTNPTNGTTSVDTTSGEITYTPSADFNGSDTFTYTVKDDADGTSNAATVTVTITSINDAPVTVDDTATLLEDAAHTINVLGNDSDIDGTLDPASVEVVTAPSSGTSVINTTSGAIEYTPNSDFNGEDTLTYRVQDNQGEWSSPGTVTLTVQAVNDAPLANADSFSIDEDTPSVLDILSNDMDVDGTLDVSTVAIVTDVSNGSLTDNGDGTQTYTPNTDFNGTDSFSYRVSDDNGESSDTVTVDITIMSVNDAPTISGTPTTDILQDESYSFTPTLDDIEADTLTVSATNLPNWLVLDSATGTLTGSTAIVGTFSDIVLTVSDGNANASLASFSITVELDTDRDGTSDALDVDDDNDGMTDEFELANNFNPLDSSDAGGDADGDGITNLEEQTQNTNPLVDDYPPVFNALDTLDINATGLLTEFPTLTPPEAIDGLDGAVTATLDSDQMPLEPGVHVLSWRATDSAGNSAQAEQTLRVFPLISMSKDQQIGEGGSTRFRIVLNGTAPIYPFNVAYTVSGTATEADHDLVASTIEFDDQAVEKTITFNVVKDNIIEGNETIVAQLTGEGNFGNKDTHTATIVEQNVAPQITISVEQAANQVRLLTQDGGDVTFTANVFDPNPEDTHTYDWDFPQASVTGTNEDLATLDPTSLSAGVYTATVTVTDSGNPPLVKSSHVQFLIMETVPDLSDSSDSDGDAIPDSEEGLADSDGDGQPDYLDSIPLPNVLNENITDGNNFLIEADPGVQLTIGSLALNNGADGAGLSNEDILTESTIPNDSISNVGGYFDFVVSDLPQEGDSVKIVIPQRQAIPENPVYRKFHQGSWFTFVEDANNSLASAPGQSGICPPPSSSEYQPGLTTGHWCVELTIEDGGPNDSDQLVNGSVQDPGGVGILSGSVEGSSRSIFSKGGGGGAIGNGLLIVLGLLMLQSIRRSQIKQLSRKSGTQRSRSAPKVKR